MVMIKILEFIYTCVSLCIKYMILINGAIVMYYFIPYVYDPQHRLNLNYRGVASYSIYFYLHVTPLDLCTRVYQVTY